MDRVSPASGESPSDPPLRARRAERLAVDGAANLRSQHWYEIEVKVRNVSTCGFMAECAEPVEIGSYVSLDVPGVGPIRAQVRWQLGVMMGGKFLDPISLVRCDWTAIRTVPPVAA